MLKPHSLCKVCRSIEKHPSLAKEIYNSSYFITGAPVTLKAIQAQYIEEFGYDSILSHVKRHQFLKPAEIRARKQRLILKQAKATAKFRETRVGDVWDKVIQSGMQKLEDGELELKAADLLKATKDKSDFELKVKDQELAMAEMVAFFASGEGNLEESKKYDRRIIEGETAEHFDPAGELTADTNSRAEQSRAFYQSLAGDAPTPGTD